MVQSRKTSQSSECSRHDDDSTDEDLGNKPQLTVLMKKKKLVKNPNANELLPLLPLLMHLAHPDNRHLPSKEILQHPIAPGTSFAVLMLLPQTTLPLEPTQ